MTTGVEGDLAETRVIELPSIGDLPIKLTRGEPREAAKLLQWGAIIAHGRMIPLENQSDATRIPPNCYTFQPERAVHAKRVGRIIDFSASERQPLEA